jgi:hypothetical protein
LSDSENSLPSFSLSELDAPSIVMVSCLMWTRYTSNKIGDGGYSAVSVDKIKNKNKLKKGRYQQQSNNQQ